MKAMILNSRNVYNFTQKRGGGEGAHLLTLFLHLSENVFKNIDQNEGGERGGRGGGWFDASAVAPCTYTIYIYLHTYT